MRYLAHKIKVFKLVFFVLQATYLAVSLFSVLWCLLYMLILTKYFCFGYCLFYHASIFPCTSFFGPTVMTDIDVGGSVTVQTYSIGLACNVYMHSDLRFKFNPHLNDPSDDLKSFNSCWNACECFTKVLCNRTWIVWNRMSGCVSDMNALNKKAEECVLIYFILRW